MMVLAWSRASRSICAVRSTPCSAIKARANLPCCDCLLGLEPVDVGDVRLGRHGPVPAPLHTCPENAIRIDFPGLCALPCTHGAAKYRFRPGHLPRESPRLAHANGCPRLGLGRAAAPIHTNLSGGDSNASHRLAPLAPNPPHPHGRAFSGLDPFPGAAACAMRRSMLSRPREIPALLARMIPAEALESLTISPS